MYCDSDIIGPDIKCSQELRAYFKERLGKGFHFLVPFQEWLHANLEKTLADACCAYPGIARMARTTRLPIWPQFKYNIFVREQFDKDPEMTLEKASRMWKDMPTGKNGEKGPLYVCKKDCSAMKIIKLSDNQGMAWEAVEWFSSKWNVPKEAYQESIEASFSAVVPSWYLCLDGDRIIAGMGVIENDFHDRKDLTPNICAVYTEEEYRCRGIAGRLLDFVCHDMASHGIETLYLLTNHTGFYERYGWEFFCMANGDGEDEPSRMYVHRGGTK